MYSKKFWCHDFSLSDQTDTSLEVPLTDLHKKEEEGWPLRKVNHSSRNSGIFLKKSLWLVEQREESRILLPWQERWKLFEMSTVMKNLYYNPSFYLWKASKKSLGTTVFCLGCLVKSATVTSFSRSHPSRNSGSRRSPDQINPHFIAVYTRWLIKKAKNCEKLSKFSVGMENFTLKKMHVARRNVD